MKYIYITVCLLITNISWSQIKLEFQNIEPIWSHSSEVAGDNNSYYYNAIKPLIVDDYAYLTNAIAPKFYQGILLEKLNLETGDVVWTFDYQSGGLENREYPDKPFIHNNKLRLPSYRESGVDVGFVKWNNSNLAYRDINIQTGEVLEFNLDTNGEDLSMPKGSYDQDGKLIGNKNKLQYLRGKREIYSLELDSSFSVVLDTQIQVIKPVFYVSSDGGFKIYGNKILHLQSSHDIFKQEESTTLRIYDLDLDFEFQKLLDISKYIPKSFLTKVELEYADDDVFIVRTIIKPQGQPVAGKNYYMFDYEGNYIDRFSVDWEDERIGKGYYYKINVQRNKEGDKLLALLANDDEDGYHNLYIMESNGEGGLVELATYRGKNKYDKFFVNHFDFLMNGDLLVSFEYIKELNPNDLNQGIFRSITMRISKDDF